jgi:hypothetical protein
MIVQVIITLIIRMDIIANNEYCNTISIAITIVIALSLITQVDFLEIS